MTILRDYQQEALQNISNEFKSGKNSVCLVLPTGSGKTKILSECVMQHLDKGNYGSVVWLAPLRSLVDQAKSVFPSKYSVVTVDETSQNQETTFPRIHIGTVQAFAANKKLRPRASLVVFDEAQYFFGSPEWGELAPYYLNQKAKILSATATPSKLNGTPLSNLADSLVTGPQVKELQRRKYLVQCKVYGFQGSSYSDIDNGINRPIIGCIEAYKQFANNTKAVVFCSTIEEAKNLSEQFNQNGISSIFADSSNRESIQIHRDNKVKVICNVYLLSVGYDDPSIETIILNRNITNPSTLIQMIGRGLRISEETNKKFCTFIDCHGVIYREHFGLPEDEREYSLTGTAIKIKNSEELNKHNPLHGCGKCGRIVRLCQSCDCNSLEYLYSGMRTVE